MTLSRTLLLPTGLEMTFACHPVQATDPMTQDPARPDFDTLAAELDAPAPMPNPFTPHDPFP
jgi:hypothetical protein